MNNQSKSPKEILEKNILKGKLAEEIAKQDYIEHGFEIYQTGIGSDFIAKRKLDNSINQIYVDFKYGKTRPESHHIESKFGMISKKTTYGIGVNFIKEKKVETTPYIYLGYNF